MGLLQQGEIMKTVQNGILVEQGFAYYNEARVQITSIDVERREACIQWSADSFDAVVSIDALDPCD